MLIAVLCREMKWTYQQYQEQPEWLLGELIAYMSAEAEYHKNQNKKQ